MDGSDNEEGVEDVRYKLDDPVVFDSVNEGASVDELELIGVSKEEDTTVAEIIADSEDEEVLE